MEARERDTTTHAPATFQRHRPCWTFSSARLTPRILEIHRRVTRRCPPVELTRSINGTVRRKRTDRFRCSISGKYPLVLSDPTRALSPGLAKQPNNDKKLAILERIYESVNFSIDRSLILSSRNYSDGIVIQRK